MTDEPEAKVQLAAWLNQQRERSGLSINGLANVLEVDRKSVKRWLGIEGKPVEIGGVSLLRMLTALGVQIQPAPDDYIVAPLNVELEEIRARLDDLIRAVKALRFPRPQELAATVGEMAESQGHVLAAVDELRERLEQLEKTRSARPNSDAK